MSPPPPRPTPDDLKAAAERTVPDVIAPDLRLLVCGINPGLWSGATGHHFAGPGNRFWKTLHAAGLTDRVLAPWEEAELLHLGIGITNLVQRTTATAAELTAAELRAGAIRLRTRVAHFRPRVVACLGVSAYRVAFDRPRAIVGRQAEALEAATLWVLPNPSGLNAHYQLPALAELFGGMAGDLAVDTPVGAVDRPGGRP